MEFKYVVAVVRPDIVGPLEQRLTSLGIGGITLSRVKGFGEYKNFFSRDWVTEHTKVEIFVPAEKVEPLLATLVELNGIDTPDAGVAAVMPVEKFLRLRTGTEALPAKEATR